MVSKKTILRLSKQEVIQMIERRFNCSVKFTKVNDSLEEFLELEIEEVGVRNERSV